MLRFVEASETNILFMQSTASAPVKAYIIISPTNNSMREVKPAMLGSREIILESITPMLSANEREVRKREVEKCLFDVFVKYAKPKTK